MLLYYCAGEDELDQIHKDPAAAPRGKVALWKSLPDARAACSGYLLVLDGGKVDLAVPDQQGRVTAEGVPRAAILNAFPYLPPRAVTAAGGFIVRPGTGEPEVLLIFRRGVWDLPKGKLDKGETIEACALREVKEEVGIRKLKLAGSLGTTVHGYVHDGAFLVKTTHWFLMQTPETDFTPQAEEDIDAVTWVPWSAAAERVGYETLRRHMADHAAAVRSVLEQAAG